ncbi:MAG: hypothetical protein NT058_00890 [Candidatus Portnoybacteria bacterium]|nr:hypothetical protein [Candidatus Portnoybacteria bacterium]
MENQKQKNTGMAIVAYILFFIPLLTDAKKDSFVRYHVRQGFLVFLCAVAVWIIRGILTWRFYGITNLLNLVVLVFAIIGIVNAANGQEKPLPLIGKFANKIKI